MADYFIAYDALVREEAYLRDMAEAEASLGESTVGMPGQIPNWGPWASLQPHITSAFTSFNEVVSSAREGLTSVADVIGETRVAYQQTEDALTVKGP